ncbi:4Fe-4S dicluster domain-containing protein [Marinobacter salicampi]|uniref:4Fe-4S dicluster domain-containing protein n=1 Tax=Marinobacter salicampi TaxID=435907 RepID=UPI00140B05FE|nr:4Fe-4S dicluster domain-containing protein [Marinobacter salicampi]
MPPIKPERDRAIAAARGPGQETGYWRTLAELNRSSCSGGPTSEITEAQQLWQAPISRRQTFHLLGASVALAGLTGCGRPPEEDLIPYVRMPEHSVPGQARYYASAIALGGYGHGVIAENHEGRPTKLEGNPDHPATLGSCDAITQAAVLSLYDPDRSASVMRRQAVSDMGSLLAELRQKQDDWDREEGRGLCLLTGTISSPSQRARIAKMQERWPRARWFLHEPVDRRQVFRASQRLFGEALEPRYRFTEAEVVLSLDADFLQSPPGFLRYAHDLMSRRRPVDPDEAFTRLYAIESTPVITGATADHRLGLAYPEVDAAARQLARELGLDVPPPERNVLPEDWVTAVVEDLRSHEGAALVVPGEQQSETVQVLAHAMNQELGAFGGPLAWMQPVAGDPLLPGLEELAQAARDGEVESLVVLAANPVYTAPAESGFRTLFSQIPWRLHWGEYQDETARLSLWHVPATHDLESWGDVRAFDGTVSLIQPMILPLTGGWTALQMLAAIGEGVESDPLQLLRDHWQQNSAGLETITDSQDDKGGNFEDLWRRALRDGVVSGTAAETVMPGQRPQALADLPESQAVPEGLVLQPRPDPALWDGRYANNGWLQEMPRPITTLTWHNALLVSPALADSHKLEDGDMVELTRADRKLQVPVMVLPGQPEQSVSLSLGFGRDFGGRVADGVGISAYELLDPESPWATVVQLQPTGSHRALAAIQTHHDIEGRDLIRAADLETYRRNPGFAQKEHHELSLYEEPWPAEREAEHAWGMAIDLSACIGCNGCVTACQAENNIPVVGAEEIARGHDLHWIRVDRYFSGAPQNPAMVFQPVPCMHCENAPCEYVCPVGATQHSADGLNQMIYQRCVGTRYCSQNCPYKVRRFNWIDYTSAAAAYPAEPAVQNPDVTVRSRGVMEKCTYCVQRISSVRQQAEAQERPIAEGELQTACQQACPTRAIVFGDLADETSEISRLKASPLNYSMLAHLNTRPRTTYLAAVKNPNPAIKTRT